MTADRSPARDHAAALDELRASLLALLSDNRRQMHRDHHANGRTETWYACRHVCAELCRQLRALDAVRAHAAERAYMAELWMLRACGKPLSEAVKEARATVAAMPEVPW